MKKYLTIILLTVLFSFGCSFLTSGAENNFNDKNQTASDVADSELSPTPATEENEPESAGGKVENDLITFAGGTLIVQKSSQMYGEKEDVNWGIIALIDGSSQKGWSSGRENTANQTAVFQLPARTTFDSFGFDTANTQETDSTAKNVTVEVSDADANSGFEKVLDAKLEEKKDGQRFEVSKKIPARWIRLTIKDNYGSPRYTQLMEFSGFGKREDLPIPENISGTYKTSSGELHIKQEGASIVGCYTYSYDYLIEGGIEGRTLKLLTTRLDKDGKGARDKKVIMIVSDESKTLTGVWSGAQPNAPYVGKWNGTKKSSEVGNCPHLPNLDKTDAVEKNLENTLDSAGRAVIYGINFDFNSDKIKDESKPTLDNIAAVLKKNSDWKMTVEGHTDNVGGESFNQNLSEKRAASVKKYLTENGINENRLKAVGFGMTKPIAENDSEAGRAQNRRVELVKQ